MTHFILCPDTASVRLTRRLIASHSPSLGVMVGTWPELLGLASSSFLLPVVKDDWQERLESAVSAATDSFWSAGLQTVPAEAPSIMRIIGQTLTMLLEGAGPQARLSELVSRVAPGRAARQLHDLATLHQAMDCLLPPQLALVARLLQATADQQLREIHVHHQTDWPCLNRWQQALVERLTATGKADEQRLSLLSQAMLLPSATAASALGTVQRVLFTQPPEQVKLDSSLQWLAVRDHLQEAEVAAGMIQQALQDDPALQAADLGLVLPDDRRYCAAVRDVFGRAGLPLSGLGTADGLRDIGHETVQYLLLCLVKPAPVLALASLLVSPLMPWDLRQGNLLAQQVSNGRFDLRPWNGCSEEAKAMLALLRKPPQTISQLKKALKKLTFSLTAEEQFAIHRARAVAALNRVVQLLQTATGEIPWGELNRVCTSEPLNPASRFDLVMEGIAVFHEGDEPWRTVRHLWVLGCSDGHYPAPVSRSPVFSESELQQLRDQAGLALETGTERGQRLRALFRRQLCAAAEAVTFLIPRRDPAGKPLSPSPAITFMASLFTAEDGKPVEEDTLVLELETAHGRDRARGLALAPEAPPTKPRQPKSGDLRFHTDLLQLGLRDDGSLKPESPSRLETLMVSPLAWLFERLGITPHDWEPETLDIMTKGTLAHGVFEHLFAPGLPVPDLQAIIAAVPGLLDDAVREHCPFLQRSEWMVEREQLKQEILKAAQRWAEILNAARAEVVATEISLQGRLGDVPVHGNADLLLELPGKRMFVVDYKKSGSGSRWKRMSRGYDHQAALYRTMIETGGLEKPECAADGLAEKLAEFRDSGEIGALYYLMNDQNVLTDTKGWLPAGLGGVQEMGDAISVAAMALIKSRTAELRAGKIVLNRGADEKEFKDNRGITPYALDKSPLLRMFMVDEQSN